MGMLSTRTTLKGIQRKRGNEDESLASELKDGGRNGDRGGRCNSLRKKMGGIPFVIVI